MAFDRYAFVDNLKEEIKAEQFTSSDEVERYIQEAIDNALIYYSDILDIAKDFDVIDYSQLASDVYEPFYEYLLSEIDEDDLLYNDDDYEFDLDTVNPDDYNADEYDTDFDIR